MVALLCLLFISSNQIQLAIFDWQKMCEIPLKTFKFKFKNIKQLSCFLQLKDSVNLVRSFAIIICGEKCFYVIYLSLFLPLFLSFFLTLARLEFSRGQVKIYKSGNLFLDARNKRREITQTGGNRET